MSVSFRTSVLRFLALILFCAAVRTGVAQGDMVTHPQSIQQQLADLQEREKIHASSRELGYRWALLGAEYGNAGDVTHAEDAYNHALQILSTSTPDAAMYAAALDQLGALYRIYGRTADALTCYRKALRVRVSLNDPLGTARSHEHLAEMALTMRHFKDAYTESDRAYVAMSDLHDPETTDIVSALIIRSYAECGMHHYAKGLADAAEALKLSRDAFPEGSVQMGASLVALGSAQLQNEDPAHGADSLREAVNIFKSHLSLNDPRLHFAMTQYRESLVMLHREGDARQIYAELEDTARQPRPSCATCTVSAFSLRSPPF